ncbi:hypothetical protein JCM10908_002845 [Rhodotorula pacifica]|uniref:uncharacterized protein n=1 Tax=Rhodotorula pacifica TaxID=1495444 RepID=UPI00317D12B2
MRLISFTVLASFAAFVAAADLNISTSLPIQQCGEVDVTFTCGEPPCTITLRPADDEDARLEGDTIVANGSLSYKAFPQPEGTNLWFWIVDNANQIKVSEPTTVTAGDSACLDKSK